MNYVGLWFSDRIDNFQELQVVIEENKKLEAQIQALEEENNLLTQKTFELDEIKEFYELDQTYSSYAKLAANVISKNPGNWFSTFTIDKGSKDGIALDMNVITNGGLVGIVTSVSYNYSIVRTIVDDESNVSGKFMSSSDLCIIQGDLTLIEDGYINITNINKDAEITDGDMIFTSHISDKYLPEILIGYVTEINVDSNNLTKSGYLKPAVDFGNIEEVFVLTKLKSTGDE